MFGAQVENQDTFLEQVFGKERIWIHSVFGQALQRGAGFANHFQSANIFSGVFQSGRNYLHEVKPFPSRAQGVFNSDDSTRKVS